MIVKVLCENTSLCDSFGCEHGLSLYIESGEHKILFDMGQTNLFEANAKKLGIDLAEIDFAVLSHGHYDHSGGLKRFLEINKSAPVYLSRYAFEPHYSGAERYIGVDQSLQECKRLVFTEDFLQITENMQLCSCNGNPPLHPVECFGLNMIDNGRIIPEDFRHEQYLTVIENGKKIVISGCSHKGILNIANWLKPDILIGGFHFSKIEPCAPRLHTAAEELLKTGTKYYTCHCTGTEQFASMKKIMGNKLEYISAGTVFEI